MRQLELNFEECDRRRGNGTNTGSARHGDEDHDKSLEEEKMNHDKDNDPEDVAKMRRKIMRMGGKMKENHDND